MWKSTLGYIQFVPTAYNKSYYIPPQEFLSIEGWFATIGLEKKKPLKIEGFRVLTVREGFALEKL